MGANYRGCNVELGSPVPIINRNERKHRWRLDQIVVTLPDAEPFYGSKLRRTGGVATYAPTVRECYIGGMVQARAVIDEALAEPKPEPKPEPASANSPFGDLPDEATMIPPRTPSPATGQTLGARKKLRGKGRNS